MCTAITYSSNSFYFGRNLDLERSYNEQVVITPRNYPFRFRNGSTINHHFAMIGMAAVAEKYPLYFEATNEKGLSIAGLNFPDNAVYHPKSESLYNIAPFELIPWILGQCCSVENAMALIEGINIWNTNFSDTYPLSPLHWLLADRQSAVTLETTKHGIQVHPNLVGVLTNNPPFEYHMHNLVNYLNCTAKVPESRFSESLNLKPYSLGMGAMGLPGDPSSASRFVKAAFTKMNSVSGQGEEESVGQFFHILSSVAQQKGVTAVSDTEFEYTMYSSCCNCDRGIYYYTTYQNSRITAIKLHAKDLDGRNLYEFPLLNEQDIRYMN